MNIELEIIINSVYWPKGLNAPELKYACSGIPGKDIPDPIMHGAVWDWYTKELKALQFNELNNVVLNTLSYVPRAEWIP